MSASHDSIANCGDPGFAGVGFLLGLAHRARRRSWEAALADLGLTAPQAAVLRLVAARSGSGVRHLSRLLGTDPMNTHRISETLIAADLCYGQADPRDARRRPLYATAKGFALAKEVSVRASQEETRLLAAIGRRHYDALRQGLEALLADAVAEEPARTQLRQERRLRRARG